MSTEVTHALDPGAGAQYTELEADQSALMLYLGSMTLVIRATPDPRGDRLLMAFCHELVQAATIVADELQLKLSPQPPRLISREESESDDD
ncbi:hypothetical protein [Labedaea rhizosphaerae]|uniref:Uncharacterized protein n=1 Tax=Labedaea rhizosphaerae TaxID=598644 RepID=A0A4R6S4U9_LABRH|nr:hypothetical protein [Labedaea rhizosphaerae]TDP93766.1 hypothetical protein EV186_106160 [Labedaea rhizosphaerae]